LVAAWELLVPTDESGNPLPQKFLAVLVPHTGSVSTEWCLKLRDLPLPVGSQIFMSRGMPLDVKPHFYETEDQPGPLWTGMTYMQWMDFKLNIPDAEKVRSLSGYSAFILGKATKGWLS